MLAVESKKPHCHRYDFFVALSFVAVYPHRYGRGGDLSIMIKA